MSNPILKSVEFHGSPIYYVSENGLNHILIRPICEALNIDADRQIRDMKADDLLGPEVSEQTTQVPGDVQRRQYTSLPEEYIYGWLFGIKFTNTMSEETKTKMIAYKQECYHILFQHFHGKLTRANDELREKARIRRLIAHKRHELTLVSPLYNEILELEKQEKLIGSPYSKLQQQQFILFKEELQVRVGDN